MGHHVEHEDKDIQYVRRTHWTKMQWTREIIDTMNTLSGTTRVIPPADVVPEPIPKGAPVQEEAAIETVVPFPEPVIPTRMTMEEAAVELTDDAEIKPNAANETEGSGYYEDVPPSSCTGEDVLVPSVAAPIRRGE